MLPVRHSFCEGWKTSTIFYFFVFIFWTNIGHRGSENLDDLILFYFFFVDILVHQGTNLNDLFYFIYYSVDNHRPSGVSLDHHLFFFGRQTSAIRFASFDKDTVDRITSIQQLDQKTKSILFNLIDTYIQNFKTKQAFAK